MLAEIDDGGELKPRVKVMRDEGGDPQYNTVDYTNLVKFELQILTPGASLAATLQDVPAVASPQTNRKILIQTAEVGINIAARVRLYTDFGWEKFYNILIIKNIAHTFNYPDNGEPSTENIPEVVYPSIGEVVVIDLLAGRVNITDLDGIQIPSENIQFAINNESYGSVDSNGVVTIWDTAVNREVIITVYIEFDSQIDFEEFYLIEVRPNIQIIADYSNAVDYEGFSYEEISFDTSFDLIAEGKILALTVDPSINPAQDISDQLTFVKVGESPINVSSNGILTYSGAIDAYITIRVETVSDYQITYRVKVLGNPA